MEQSIRSMSRNPRTHWFCCFPSQLLQDLKTVVLINCGATEDVRELCELPEAVRVIIIDSHRPIWHGHNDDLDMNTLVLVDGDDPVPKSKVPTYDAEWEEAAQGALMHVCMFLSAAMYGLMLTCIMNTCVCQYTVASREKDANSC